MKTWDLTLLLEAEGEEQRSDGNRSLKVPHSTVEGNMFKFWHFMDYWEPNQLLSIFTQSNVFMGSKIIHMWILWSINLFQFNLILQIFVRYILCANKHAKFWEDKESTCPAFKKIINRRDRHSNKPNINIQGRPK